MSLLCRPRLRVPCHTRIVHSSNRALASLTASNTAANASQSRPINPLTIQAASSGSTTPLTPSAPNTPTPAPSSSLISSYPFPSNTSKPQQHRRALHTSTARSAKKGAEKRDEIDTESTEYSKSGTDAQSAAQQDAAFTPGRNDPKEQMDKAGEGVDAKGNPLSASPANHDISQPVDDAATGGDSKGGSRSKPSGGGSPSKAGKVGS